MYHGQLKLAGVSIPLAHSSEALRRVAKMLAFVGFTALGAQLAVHLPFTPVPITLQTLFVVLAGMTLGAGDGFYAMLSYLGLGLSGAPVFAGFSFGAAALFGPTGGYLFAFPAAAALSGYVVERIGRGRGSALLAAALGMALILLSGASYLMLLSGASFGRIASIAILPFVAGEIVKSISAAFLTGRGGRA